MIGNLYDCFFEFLGTLVLVLLGDGVVACVSLSKSKGQGAGWVVVTLAWGFAVMCGVFIAGPISGAHLNPAVTIGLALAGTFPAFQIFGYVIAQMLGGFVGAILVYMFYKDHFTATEDPTVRLGCFCTAPAIRNLGRNLFCEILATGLLVLLILFIGTDDNTAMFSLGAVGALPVTMVIMAIGMSLGGTTGYALNPARDLSPRIAHALVLGKKESSDWGYSWVPVLGPIIGASLAAGAFLLINIFAA